MWLPTLLLPVLLHFECKTPKPQTLAAHGGVNDCGRSCPHLWGPKHPSSRGYHLAACRTKPPPDSAAPPLPCINIWHLTSCCFSKQPIVQPLQSLTATETPVASTVRRSAGASDGSCVACALTKRTADPGTQHSYAVMCLHKTEKELSSRHCVLEVIGQAPLDGCRQRRHLPHLRHRQCQLRAWCRRSRCTRAC